MIRITEQYKWKLINKLKKRIYYHLKKTTESIAFSDIEMKHKRIDLYIHCFNPSMGGHYGVSGKGNTFIDRINDLIRKINYFYNINISNFKE